jgi:hypothetical protein
VDEPPTNNTWLLQKHRDIIKDYTDVHADEKEYISEWDAYSMTRRATVAPYLKDIYLDFIEEKASWLTASQNRMNETLKHLAYLNGRDALDRGTVVKVLSVLRNTRSQGRHAPPQTRDPSPKPESRFSKSGCAICGQPVPATSNQLICANLVSNLGLQLTTSRSCLYFYSPMRRIVTTHSSTTTV